MVVSVKKFSKRDKKYTKFFLFLQMIAYFVTICDSEYYEHEKYSKHLVHHLHETKYRGSIDVMIARSALKLFKKTSFWFWNSDEAKKGFKNIWTGAWPLKFCIIHSAWMEDYQYKRQNGYCKRVDKNNLGL